MQSSAGQSGTAAGWKALYEAAVLELDPHRLIERIEEAQQAILSYMKTLDNSCYSSEKESLTNALEVLHDLRRIDGEEGKTEAA
jgi:hypothetical protein